MNMDSGQEVMFTGLVNNSDGKSLDMDIESLDRTELQRSVSSRCATQALVNH